MTRTILFILLAATAWSANGTPEQPRAIDISTLQTAVPKDAKVFEIKGGEAVVGLPYLKRIEMAPDSALLTVRNERKSPLAPQLDLEFFNAYGMRLCLVVASFEGEPIAVGGVGAKKILLTLPELEPIFATSSIKLPTDWKTIRFISVRQLFGDRQSKLAKPATNPLPKEERFEGENKEGFSGSIAKRLDYPRALPEKQEGAKTDQDFDGPQSMMHALDPRRPRPRPQIVKQQQVRPAVLSENNFGTANIGPTAVDARWSNYGAYLQRMIDTVQIQWERIIIEKRANPVLGSTVSVKFIMDSEGKIAKIVNVDSTANETASRACINAITDRSPYGPWTDDMRAVLGDQQEMTFTFYYQ
jgi:hypothetical protein